jgi:hypothetical protein
MWILLTLRSRFARHAIVAQGGLWAAVAHTPKSGLSRRLPPSLPLQPTWGCEGGLDLLV